MVLFNEVLPATSPGGFICTIIIWTTKTTRDTMKNQLTSKLFVLSLSVGVETTSKENVQPNYWWNSMPICPFFIGSNFVLLALVTKLTHPRRRTWPWALPKDASGPFSYAEECWSGGVMGIQIEIRLFACPNTPILQPSNTPKQLNIFNDKII